MKFSEDVICKVCKKVFCCAECRYKHGIKHHAIRVVRKSSAPMASISEVDDDNNVNDVNNIGDKNVAKNRSNNKDNDYHQNNNIAKDHVGFAENQQTKNLQASTIYLFCPICEGRSLVLHEIMHKEMLQHIKDNHLPVHCKKCGKIYTKIDELKEFTKCLNPKDLCSPQQQQKQPQERENNFVDDTATSSIANQTCNTDSSKITVKKATGAQTTTIATQTSPFPKMNDYNETQITPVSLLQLQWKSKGEFISDSVSSIKNLSSVSNTSIQHHITATATIAGKGKLVRSTSTPLQSEMQLIKPKDQTFNASGGQVSSIYNSSNDVDNSPGIQQNPSCASPTKQTVENLNRFPKLNNRVKMSAVTPLRQVMSKSIQKAFAEHGIPSTSGPALVHTCKKIFDSCNASSGELSGTNAVFGSPLDLRLSSNAYQTRSLISDSSNSHLGVLPIAASSIKEDHVGNSPVDLRLSPVIRRTQSEGSAQSKISMFVNHGKISGPSQATVCQEILLSSQKLTTESIVITRTKRLSIEKSEKCAINSDATAATSLSNDNCSKSSVYKSCQSVEIITKSLTELSEEYLEQEILLNGAKQCHDINPSDNIVTLSGHLQHPPPTLSSNLSAFTPITRIPGAVINKKIIKFETPIDEGSQKEDVDKSIIYTTATDSDVFFTPNVTPARKLNSFRSDSSEDGSGKRNTNIVPRKLCGRISPLKRPPIRKCSQSSAFTRVSDDNVITDDDDDNDEVFLPEKKMRLQQRIETDTQTSQPPPPQSVRGVIINSLNSLVSSVMRLSSVSSLPMENAKAGEYKPITIIKRCASIAGSLVRTKSQSDSQQNKSLKRKRANTMERQKNNDALSPNSENLRTAPKRCRIQPRKPLRHSHSTQF